MTEVLQVQKSQLAYIFKGVSKLDWTEEERKAYLLENYGVTSTKDLGYLGAERLITDLEEKMGIYSTLKDKRRKQIIAICYDKCIMQKDGVFDEELLNKFLMSHGKHKVEFNKQTLKQLEETSFQLKKFSPNAEDLSWVYDTKTRTKERNKSINERFKELTSEKKLNYERSMEILASVFFLAPDTIGNIIRNYNDEC